jgi:hypothetical protein
MEQEYRRFLAMHLAHPDAEIVPCHLVDEMWHGHILDTIAYREDCEELFGEFLDHYPYFGMQSDEEVQALNDAYADTLEIYEREFGEPPEGTWISADAAAATAKTASRRGASRHRSRGRRAAFGRPLPSSDVCAVGSSRPTLRLSRSV